MKLVEPTVEQIFEENPFKQIEKIGRLCYKSEDKITEDSWKNFISMLINNKHYAMLEHGIFHFNIFDDCIPDEVYAIPGVTITQSGEFIYQVSVSFSAILQHYEDNILFKTMFKLIGDEYNWHPCGEIILDSIYFMKSINLVNQTTVLSYILHSELASLDKSCCEKELLKHQFRSLKFTCSRGISHELVRHRCSIAQESTRYCNYSKDKFGGEISFILPSVFDDWDISIQQQFLDNLNSSEQIYFNMINEGISPQYARDILPNALKTEVVLTMSMSQWNHFFDIRYFGTTGNPHPDMKILAKMAYEILN